MSIEKFLKYVGGRYDVTSLNRSLRIKVRKVNHVRTACELHRIAQYFNVHFILYSVIEGPLISTIESDQLVRFARDGFMSYLRTFNVDGEISNLSTFVYKYENMDIQVEVMRP